MQNCQSDYSDLEDLPTDEIKTRLGILGVDIDPHEQSREYYENLYMELKKDPNNRMILKRYGVFKCQDNEKNNERFTSKKRMRGNS
jgi:hypothetical protein